MKKKQHILKNCLENTFGKKIIYSKECNALSDDIYRKIHIKISSQTLRRLFGFIEDGVQISNSTLGYLANYVGYDTYDEFTTQNKEVENFIDPKDVSYIKLFYSITPIKSQQDENYHNASKNIAQILYQKPELLQHTSTFLSQNTAAQIYFFERFPFIDKLSSGYALHLKKYLTEKLNPEAQVFGNCLIYMGYALSNNNKRTKVLQTLNAIPSNSDLHPFPLGRKYACNILEHYLNDSKEELEQWIKMALIEATTISKRRKEYKNFPYFQFIISDILNLIERPTEAKRVLNICELDYKRVPGFNLDEGYLEALDLVKAINLVQQGKNKDAKRILARSTNTDILFIMHDYFLIQRLLIELALVKSSKSLKYKKMYKEINGLINKTRFYFFKDKLK